MATGGVDHVLIERCPARQMDGSRYAGFVYGAFGVWRDRWPFVGAEFLIASPIDDPDMFIGWIAVIPAQNRIVYAYTKAAYRASPGQRYKGAEDGFRIASTLAIAGGIDFQRPVPCSFTSRAARAIFSKPGNPYMLVLTP